ncbi:ChrR family anti-sigma-E factor [Rhodobacteraceae bacterium N5(2021)]|uniref:ChrR family anti-sigma-E factor n=1 Tax=Gymnodinialimonas phycosphaerae TaxID=2841589 RepID=A0A975TSD1_9RHOB|nr:ChrR family anti-sigma-E factor [Gymnodinialimonas phycosphaerae]MBY4893933.1 ChrR family anti-sigma-E factor [Gymnodinialimonas phycosphaerae]
MTDTHHSVPDDMLMGYASGSLAKAFDLVLATHVSLSDDARARLETFEALGGAVLCDMEAVEVADDSLEQTMAKIRGAAPIERPTPSTGTFPVPLQAFVGGDEEAVRWRSIGGGVKQCVLHSDDQGTARLLLIPAGKAMPQHSHHGTEMTLVLKGAFRDEDGVFARGDLEVADSETNHQPIAEPGEDCICLVATNAKLKFQGLLPRIAQPFVGI